MIEIREKQKETFLKAEAEQEAMVEELEELEVALKKQMQSFAQTPEPVLLEESAAPAATQGDYDAFVQISHRHHRKKEVNFATLDASSPTFQKISNALTMMVNTRWMDPESLKNIKTLQQGGAFIQDGQDPVAAQQA